MILTDADWLADPGLAARRMGGLSGFWRLGGARTASKMNGMVLSEPVAARRNGLGRPRLAVAGHKQ